MKLAIFILRRSPLMLAAAAFLLLGQSQLQAQVEGRSAFFSRPPLFEEATTTRDAANRANPGYYFQITVPEDAGQALQRVVIAQRDGDSNFREVEFEPEKTRAFIGSGRRGEELSLGEVVWDEAANAVSVEFDPPVAPGTEVALRLQAERNPRRGGVYLFGVTVFPEGASPSGVFIGYGRIHIYENSDRDFFSRFRYRRH
ncbi:MAG: DUF2808 domain-containing protein [Cyanobacteria bacterium P01_A01_bin.135]